MRLNAFVNPYIFPLGAEKNLLFKLMAASCTGPKRVTYMKPPGSASKNPKLAVEAVMQVHECSSKEANHLLELMSPDDVLQCAEQAGLDKAEMTKLKAEYKDSDGSRGTTKERKKPATKR